jgi:DNA-binding FadR family transcriptional regulator
MCRHFSVSRTNLREAVKVLAIKGLIELRPRTGIRLWPCDAWNFVDRDLLGWLCEAGVDERFIQDL